MEIEKHCRLGDYVGEMLDESSISARLARWVDQAVISFAAARLPKPGRFQPHGQEAAQLLASPDFFHPSVAPAALELVNKKSFQFASPVATPYPQNNRVPGRFYPCPGRWQDKPAVILLHGWNDHSSYYARYPLAARKLNHAGFNAVIIALPYHFERKPNEPGAVRNILSEDLLRSVEGVRQAVADIRAMAGWLAQQGCPRIGLMGFSLGAWLGGLALCHEKRLDFGIIMAPVVLMDRLVQEIKFAELIRHSIREQPVDFSKLNLVSHQPRVARQNLLLVEAQYDLFMPRETLEQLWKQWGEPEIWRLPLGHITALGSVGLITRSVRWLERASDAETFRDTNRLPAR